MFDAVLVANRGEIAVRVLRTLRRLGIRSVAVVADDDIGAPHAALADEVVRLRPGGYLDAAAIVAAALATGAQAVHPGYGFLSENAGFARACAAAGLVFVGPPAGAVEAMGDKIAAKRLAADAGVPILPGVAEPGLSDDDLVARAGSVGFPLLVKPSAGGGGKGMQVVRSAADLPAALAAARRLAQGAFGDDALLLERWVDRPRHVEVQVLADAHGTCVALGDRDCSLQRRHQKVVEEAPAPDVDPEVRGRMHAAAVALAQAVGYRSAGTVEFLLDGGDFWFLEMNTRLQVEHPVTEAVLGLDLVAAQLSVAAGAPLALGPRAGAREEGHDAVDASGPADLVPSGHAVEARVYAEDPDRGFLPTGGRVLGLVVPDGVRVDLGIAPGTVVGTAYDPMVAKVVAHGDDRAEALRRLDAALAGFAVPGVTVNVAFLRRLLALDDVRAGRMDTGLIDRLPEVPPAPPPRELAILAALLPTAGSAPPPGVAVDPFDVPSRWRVGGVAEVTVGVEVGGEVVQVHRRGGTVRVGDEPAVPADVAVSAAGVATLRVGDAVTRWAVARDGDQVWATRGGTSWRARLLPRLPRPQAEAADARSGTLRAPLPGTVTVVTVAEGDQVTAGQTLLVLEAMKMEHPIPAPTDGTVTKLLARPGAQVPIDAPLAIVTPT